MCNVFIIILVMLSFKIIFKPLSLSSAPPAFSPPSVSASLKDEQLLVKVQFPCAANRRCSLGRCCPISELIDPWTTVTVYNHLNHSEYQVFFFYMNVKTLHTKIQSIFNYKYCVYQLVLQ